MADTATEKISKTTSSMSTEIGPKASKTKKPDEDIDDEEPEEEYTVESVKDMRIRNGKKRIPVEMAQLPRL